MGRHGGGHHGGHGHGGGMHNNHHHGRGGGGGNATAGAIARTIFAGQAEGASDMKISVQQAMQLGLGTFLLFLYIVVLFC